MRLVQRPSAAGAALLVVLAGCAGAAGDRQVRSEVPADSSSGTQSDLPAEVASFHGDGWHKVFAHSINDAGVIAGAVHRSNYYGCAVIWESGAARPLVRPSGRISSSAYDINNAGTVTGTTSIPLEDGGTNEHASLWSRGDVADLRVSGGKTSSARAINAHGHVAGTYWRADGNSRAFLWDGSRSQDLGDSPDSHFTRVFATDINDHNTIVGYLLPVQDESPQAIRILGSDAFIWRNGVMRTLLPDSDFIDFEPSGINNAGDVVGYMMPRNPERKVGFLLSGGKLTELAPPAGWRQSDAAGINERGQIVGSAVDSLSRLHAVLWEGGRLRVLGKLPGDTHSRATSINARGQVVGYSEGARERTRAFLWENGTMRELGPPAAGDPRCRQPTSADPR
jgi:probable HAF family extracellular repeat protein